MTEAEIVQVPKAMQYGLLTNFRPEVMELLYSIPRTQTPILYQQRITLSQVSKEKHPSHEDRHIPPVADTLKHLQKLSGLTWAQWGKLFGVSRRSVHMWAAGAPMNSIHAQRLADLQKFFLEYEGKNPEDVRLDLLKPIQGESKFRRLVNQIPQAQPVNKPAFTAKELLEA